jgi:uncharacterized protein YbaP (TraB family)
MEALRTGTGRLLFAGSWLIFLLLFFERVAQPGTQESTPGTRTGKHCLWKIQSKTNTVYLLGSVHVLRAEHYPLSPVIERVFHDSRKVTLELLFDDINPQVVQTAMLAKGKLEAGGSLKTTLAPDAYGLLKRHAEELGIPVESLDSFKPWVVALTLTTLKLQKLGYDPQHGVDRYLARKAQQAGKEISGLESFEFQIHLFDRLSPDEQEKLLLHTLRDFEVVEKEFARLVGAWVEGDTAVLEKILLASFRDFPEIYARMVVERNRRWLDELERILGRDEVTLVVVGAGHLVGSESLIAMLKNQGYGVEQL